MTDLQCAARLVVLNPPGLTEVEVVAQSLASQKLAAVYYADDGDCPGLATALAACWGLTAQAARDDDLGDVTAGFEQIVDQHRGETVAVVRPGRSPVPILYLVDSDAVVVRPLT